MKPITKRDLLAAEAEGYRKGKTEMEFVCIDREKEAYDDGYGNGESSGFVLGRRYERRIQESYAWKKLFLVVMAATIAGISAVYFLSFL